MQIARGAENKFQLMYNGEDDQREYRKKNKMSKIDMCRAIRFGAYDGLIHAWPGKIKVVTSMGKQSTGKSYKLNHLFGTKFDISGARCTDGVWMTVRIVFDTLYIICDFEGLGSHEREPQEDVLLSTFNAALSSCTLFKCENRFDRDIEEMFIRFQSGVEYLKGSKNCFMGKLLIIIKDVIDNAMDEAANEFEKRIGRLAKQAGKIKKVDSNGETIEDSGFFVKQMYGGGYALITYPPLATKEFFSDLNDVIQPQIEGKKVHFRDEYDDDDDDDDDHDDIDDEKEQMDAVHNGGKEFLNNHMKMIMSQMNIGDWGAMSSEGALMRINTIESFIGNAVSVGAVIKPDKIEIGVSFSVEEDQNLLLLDENRVISVSGEEIIAELKNDEFKKFANVQYQETITTDLNNTTDEKQDSNSTSIEKLLLPSVNNIEDAGLLLDRKQSLDFFWKQFKISVHRTHQNFASFSKLFQVFLFMIYIRRKLRVNKFITANTNRYKTLKETEIDKLFESAKTQLSTIRESLTLCKSAHCNECLFPCLLRNGHEEPHNCRDENDHQCQEFCEYCGKDESTTCNYKCGHHGKHKCKAVHTCTKTCVLNKYRGCNERCILEINHDETETCVCNSNEHFCDDTCIVAVAGCEKKCVYQYTSHITSPKDHVHVCDGIEGCLETCPVMCFDAFTKTVKECGRRCASKDHTHQMKMDNDECKDKAHFCGEQHFCPKKCSIKGWCSVDYEKKIIASGKKYKGKQYDECAVGNSRKEYCIIRIPENKMKHDDTSHKCEHKKHSCAAKDSQCSLCGYFCIKDDDHTGLHKCQHGNMRNTVFYAAKQDKVTMGTGNATVQYSHGDQGIAEHCNLYCENAGRGHIHLEICKVGEDGAHVSGTRHQTKDYYPNKAKHKDEIKHRNFWQRKGWEDPCSNNILKATFNKCPYICTHPTHKQSEEKDNVDDTTKYCTLDLWHDEDHVFKCVHPFSEAHVIFICDISGSMGLNDNGTSEPDISCIVNPNGHSLKNRLGALFQSIYKFVNARMDKGCNKDKLSAIMTPGKPHQTYTEYISKAAVRIGISRTFVQDYLLKYFTVDMYFENYGTAFADAEEIINSKEHTVVIFLTDGYSSDNGAAAIVKRCSDRMKNKFKLFCLTLGPKASEGNATVENIKNQAGTNGKCIKILSGNELGNAFTSIARHMNGEAGAFM